MTRPTLLDFVTCEFGRKGSWAAGYHTGIDYRAAVGTEIFATRRGTVEHAGWGGYGEAYGHHVIIRSWHKTRYIKHMYAHLSSDKVSVGDKVVAGQTIGLSGETGNVFGAHLHYEERVYPYGYYNHIEPVLPYYRPSDDNVVDKILKRIGVRK